MPIAQWKRNGEALRETQRVNTLASDGFATLIVKDCQLVDAGTYEVEVSNAAGSKTVPIKVLYFWCTWNPILFYDDVVV